MCYNYSMNESIVTIWKMVVPALLITSMDKKYFLEN